MDNQLTVFFFNIVLFCEVSKDIFKYLMIRVISYAIDKFNGCLKRKNFWFYFTLFNLSVVFWKSHFWNNHIWTLFYHKVGLLEMIVVLNIQVVMLTKQGLETEFLRIIIILERNGELFIIWFDKCFNLLFYLKKVNHIELSKTNEKCRIINFVFIMEEGKSFNIFA